MYTLNQNQLVILQIIDYNPKGINNFKFDRRSLSYKSIKSTAYCLFCEKIRLPESKLKQSSDRVFDGII